MRADTARRLLEVGHQLVDSLDIENGMPDCFMGRCVDVGRIPVIENHFQRYTQNTIHTPEQIAQAREARLAGVHAIHGIKTTLQLNAILS